MSTIQTLLERDEELELLSDLLEEARFSEGRVVLIRGEAGIGKTSLVREFLARHENDTNVLFGACDDLLTPQPLAPFWDIARTEHSLLAPLEKGNRQALLTSTLDFLERSLRPTVLVIEDTQWADEATLDAIKYLGRRIDQTHGLLVLIYRDTEVDHDHPLRAVIGELPPGALIRIQLKSLSAEAVASMIGTTTSRDIDEIVALTDGNPLFVSEMTRAAAEEVPLSVRDAVVARAAKLSPKARETVDLISVIPGPADREIVDAVLGPTAKELAECQRQGLIEIREGTVAFRHELTRRGIESALNPERRRELNARILGELQTRSEFADPALLVHHAREADDIEAIVAYAPTAARTAQALNAHVEAVAHFRVLEPYLDLVPPSGRAVIYEEWARSEGDGLDNYPRARDLLMQAIELYRAAGDDAGAVRALLYAVRVTFWAHVEPDQPERCLEEALSILETSTSSRDLAYATSQHAYLAMLRGDDLKASKHADRAAELAEEAGDESVLIQALNTKGVATFGLGDGTGIRLLQEAAARARAAGNTLEETRALHNLGWAALGNRDLSVAESSVQAVQELAFRSELPGLENPARALQAELLRRQGEWGQAEDLIYDTLASDREGAFHGRLSWVLGTLDTRRGRPMARDHLRRAWMEYASSLDVQDVVFYAGSLAENMWLTGEVDPDLLTLFWDRLHTDVHERSPWHCGELALWLWKLGELSEAPEWIAEPYRLIIEGEPMVAAQMWEERGYPYEKAIALWHGDTDARLEALEILEDLGAAAVAAKLRQELREQGVAVPRGRARKTRAHPVGLTPRQDEVLGLLAEGLSNVEIADRLFLSPRTVEHHVSAVLSKLNASTRDEAVSAAAAQSLIHST